LAGEAVRQADALGMPPLEAQAQRLVGELDARTPGLTRREHEVAGLLAAGLTNRQIAERLYVTERTAQNHVQHILTKLNMTNRTQVAAWMSRRK
jgi:DNA-binding NarL/FixJ family response regulator